MASCSGRAATSATGRSCTRSASRCPTSRDGSVESAVRRRCWRRRACDRAATEGALMRARGFVLWFTGLSGAGKSTLASRVAPILRERGLQVEILDGDAVRENLSKGLSFSKADRDVNVRRIAFVANLLARNGVCAITAAISPYRAIREECRRRSEAPFVEVFVDAPLSVTEARDVKGLYKQARAGEIPHFTGVTDPYEPPLDPEIVVRTGEESLEASVAHIIAALEARGLVPA
ncbi:MAG: adenylyl-sulfate kinase [Planctomycetes bacterium]|nr:adenylyl-sulfate kinase [Planctomycetota bacterium]